MEINFIEKKSGSDLEPIGIDFSFLSLFWNLATEKQHKILLAYMKAVRIATHPDHNPNFSASENKKFAKLFNKFDELEDFGKFTEQLEVFKSDKSNFVSLINEISRERNHFAEERKRTLKEITALQKERNELLSDIRELKKNQVKRKPR